MMRVLLTKVSYTTVTLLNFNGVCDKSYWFLKLYVCAVRRKVQTVLFTGFRKKSMLYWVSANPGSNRVRM